MMIPHPTFLIPVQLLYICIHTRFMPAGARRAEASRFKVHFGMEQERVPQQDWFATSIVYVMKKGEINRGLDVSLKSFKELFYL